MIKAFLVVALLASCSTSTCAQIVDFSFLDSLHLELIDKPIDWFLFDFLPRLIDQKPSSKFPENKVFKEYLLNDYSNDDAAYLSTRQLIIRSGYNYEQHDAIADDGYVTRLTRIINPLADRRYLRQPPVLMEHGGAVDSSCWIISSSIQHHPEVWPRIEEDGPITSWNNSLAFVLANNGFDVWLAETRGSSDENRRYMPSKALQSVIEGRNRLKNMTAGENKIEVERDWGYWDFTEDDIIAHEIKSHIDLVLGKTRSKKLLMLTYSISTSLAFGFFSTRPDYANKVQGFVSMAPIVSGEHVDRATKLIFETLCPMVPDKVGTILLHDFIFTQNARDFVLTFSTSKWWRYKFVKAFANCLYGASAKYQTLYDLNVINHVFRSISFKEAKQFCQHMRRNSLSKFDYGKSKNLIIYGTEEPPQYKLSNFNVKDWIIVSAKYDGVSTDEVYKHLMREVHPKPKTTIFAPFHNHIDLVASLDNDQYINLPVLNYFQSRSTAPVFGVLQRKIGQRLSSARQLDMNSLIIPGLEDLKSSDSNETKLSLEMPKELRTVVDTVGTFQRELTKSINLNTSREINFEQIQSNMQKMLSGFENFSLEHLEKL